MKNLLRTLVLAVVCCLPSVVHSQIPTIAQIYNYSAGDSFLYKVEQVMPFYDRKYQSRIILLRDDSHFPDSIVYSIQIISLDSNGLNPVVEDTIRQVYRNCNDPIYPYNGFTHCYAFSGDSCGYDSVHVTTDTLFPGLTIYQANFDCGFWDYGRNNAAEGLGVVHAWLGCGDFVLQAYDIILVHYYKNTPTGISLFANDRFQIYPNPATNTVTLSVDESMIGSIVTVSDIMGRRILISNIEHRISNIETSSVAKGVYFVTVTTDDGRTATKKLMVSK